MITYEELQAASEEFDAIRRHQWLTWVRTSARFKENPAFFTGLDVQLDGLTTMQKRALNVLAPKIEKLNREVSISGGEDAVQYKMRTERDWLIAEGIDSIYDMTAYFESVGVIGNIAVTEQRPFPYCEPYPPVCCDD